MLRCLLVLVPGVILLMFLLQKSINPLAVVPDDWRQALGQGFYGSKEMKPLAEHSAGPCAPHRVCEDDHFSFSIQSGAANVVGPRICINNQLVLGTALNNAGVGINIVIVDGKSGGVIKSSFFNMYDGDVEPLIMFLKEVELGSVVLMASFDEPSSKLNDEARKLISDLGSTSVRSLGFRDSWVFVGGKGATVKNNFEKYMKNDKGTNKYDNWPEVLQLHGCIPVLLQEPAAAAGN
ncbi:protein FAM3C isoform X2 [Betta splendens]|nr:protein FAM3C isoform X2 [Betta splendens]XP_055365352.1 protein FAM3C isoform X2 [Betta splendens]